MLEKAIKVTQEGKYTHLTYARFADDLVVLVDGHCGRWKWLEKAVYQRVREELDKLKVELNQEKTRIVDLEQGESFTFLGFCFWQCKTLKGALGASYMPTQKARKEVITKLKRCFRKHKSQSTEHLITTANSILRGWTNYFKIGHSTRCFSYVKQWVEKKLRRHLSKTRKRKGFGWKRWSKEWIYNTLKLYNNYRVSYVESPKA
jgi:RNA-directed DNA polymerase